MPGLPKNPTDEDFVRVISRNVLAYRKLKGLTQTELGERIGLSRASVGDIEAGRNRVSSETLARIARALSVSADALLGLDPPPPGTDDLPSLRFLKRLQVIEAFPEAKKKHILRTLDDAIEAQSKKATAEA